MFLFEITVGNYTYNVLQFQSAIKYYKIAFNLNMELCGKLFILIIHFKGSFSSFEVLQKLFATEIH